MPSLIAYIADQQKLLDELNYLNMDEIRSFCDDYGIPYRICILTPDGTRRRTPDIDRKGIILDRVRGYLMTGTIPEPTCFPASVVSSKPPSRNLKATDSLLYGHYDKKSVAMMTLLKNLTEGQFKNGAIARILANEFWRNGKAPTYQEYADRWLQAQRERSRPNPAWAFLSDVAAGRDTTDWKQQRVKRAKGVLKLLRSLEPNAKPAAKKDR